VQVLSSRLEASGEELKKDRLQVKGESPNLNRTEPYLTTTVVYISSLSKSLLIFITLCLLTIDKNRRHGVLFNVNKFIFYLF